MENSSGKESSSLFCNLEDLLSSALNPGETTERMEAVEDGIDRFTVGSVPTVMYIPDFITDREEVMLLNNVYNAPVSKWKLLKNRRLQNWGGAVHTKGLLEQDLPPWLTRITHRIFEKSGLFPSAINHVLINEYLPNQGIMPHQDGSAYYPVVAILSLGSPIVMDFTPHSSLGQSIETSENDESINMPPEGPMQMNFARLSNDYQPFSVVMMPRSLLIFKDKAYSDYLHGITDREVQQIDKGVNLSKITKTSGPILFEPDSENKHDVNQTGGGKFIHRTTTRISLTCRLVTKTHKNLLKI